VSPAFPFEQTRTAVHEAGHAVTAYIVGVRFRSVSCVPDATSAGRVMVQGVLRKIDDMSPEERARGRPVTGRRMDRRLMVLVGGAVAVQQMYLGYQWSEVFYGDDQAVALRYARALWPNEDVADAYLTFTAVRVRALLLEPLVWEALRTLFCELLERQELGERRVRTLLARAGLPAGRASGRAPMAKTTALQV
jgi:hypothetical protein